MPTPDEVMVLRRMTVHLHDLEGQEIMQELTGEDDVDFVEREDVEFAEMTWRRSYLWVSIN